MPSSISSSDIHYRKIPNHSWRLIVLTALVILIVSITAWEGFARSKHHLPGTFHGFPKLWSIERHKLDGAHNYRVLLTGSSRMLWAADLNIMQQALGTRPLQLSIPGTSPALIVKDIVDNTDFDGLILVGAVPFLFNRLDEGFFGGDALDTFRNEMPSQWAGEAIHRWLSNYFGFLDESFDLFRLIERYSNLSMRSGAKNLMAKDWKLGNHYEDFQTDMWGPVEQIGSFDNTQITNFWTPGLERPAETPERMGEMAEQTIKFFAPLVKKLQARGGDIIFIRMPGTGKYLEHDLKTDYRNLTWEPMAEGFDALAINCMDYPELSSHLDIPEWSHLSRASQDKWSAQIIPFIEKKYKERSNKSIYDIIMTQQGIKGSK